MGKIIATCNERGEARILDEDGKSWLVHSSWIWRDRQKPTTPVMPDSSGDSQEPTRTSAWTPLAQTFGMTRLTSPQSDMARTGFQNKPPQGTPATEVGHGEDTSDSRAENGSPVADRSALSAMTWCIVSSVMTILILVALAGSVSFVSVAFSLSRAVGMGSASILDMTSHRNITSDGIIGDVHMPGLADARTWFRTDPVVAGFTSLVAFVIACCLNSIVASQFGRMRNGMRALTAMATRHVVVIVAFIFIGCILARADAISDSEVVQFQRFVAGHQDQPIVMKYYRVASQVSASWTNTIILPDYERIDVLLGAAEGDGTTEWSVYDSGAFRHVVNASSKPNVVPGSIRKCNISVRGVFDGSGKPPEYMCDAIDIVKTQNGTAELLLQDALMIETCPHPLVAGGRLAWGGFSAHIAPCNGQSTLMSPGGDVIHLANRGILFIPRATAVAGEVIATMTPTHSNISLFVGFSGLALASLRNIAYWWKKLGGKRCDQFDKVNDMTHDILRNGTFEKLLRAFEKWHV